MKFSESYQTLNEIAKELKSAGEPDIDALVPMVKEATKAYKSCKVRLQEVQAALDEHLSEIDTKEE